MNEATVCGILPFSVSRKEAVRHIKIWSRQGLFSPGDFLSDQNLDRLEGIYIPFWLFQVSAKGVLTGTGTRDFLTEEEGEEQRHSQRFQVEREISAKYRHVAVCASSQITEQETEALEPFDLERLRPFKEEYLKGFQREECRKEAGEFRKLVESRVEGFASAALEGTVSGYDKLENRNISCELTLGEEELAYFPVWYLNYRQGDRSYPVLVNGQTGKLMGKLPLSIPKIALWFLLITGLSFLVLLVLYYGMRWLL